MPWVSNLMSGAISDRSPGAAKARPLHVLTITPFFPHAENPVYGTYVSEPLELFPQFGLRSSVIGVSPLHHKQRNPLSGGASEWMRYPSLPGNFGLSAAGFFLYYRLLPFVRQLHRRERVDVIHAHAALPCAHAASLLAQRLHVPFVVTVHGLDVSNACSESGAQANRRARRSAQVYGSAASVVCISASVEKILQQGMPTPVRSCVIHNGVNPELFSPAEEPVSADPHKIVSVGNLIPTKGQDIILRAVARVAASFPDLSVEIIGEGPERKRLSDLARLLGISERVCFLGRQSREAVAKAIRECTIFALPSRFEGLGCVYLEAMACAKPVIACEGQGIDGIIEHGRNGWLIPADGAAELGAALQKLLATPELRSEIGANARKTVLNGLTLSDQTRRLADLYRDVVRPSAKNS